MTDTLHRQSPSTMLRALLAATLLVGAAHGLACPVATNSACNMDTLRCCDTQLQNALGLNSNCTGAFYDEPQCHGGEIEKIYANGTAGLFKVCSAFTGYYQCLGMSVASCTSMQYHMGNGMDLQSALRLMGIYKEFGFACGAGLDTFANTDQCMSGVFTNQAASISACRATFTNNLLANWNQRCIYYQEYNGCMQKLFGDACQMEAGWWGCEYARQGARTVLHDCFAQCSVTSKFV